MSRIELLASLNKDANSLVDVGCDHGYVAIKAIKEYNAKHAYLLDVNQLPLESAKKNVSHEGLLDKTDFLLSDGLIKYEGPTDNLVIAGMGGMLITKILSDSLSKAKCFKKVILEANNEVDKLRGFLINNHFVFDDEFIIKDGKKASPVTLFVMSGNFFELLNNVVALGNDIDDNFIGTAAPSVLVKGLKISGK